MMGPMDARRARTLLDLAERASAGSTGPDGDAAIATMEQHHDDLLAALSWSIDEGRTDEALRFANALYRFWIPRQRFSEGAAWFERALASQGGDDRLRGSACINAGFMPFWMGEDDRAAARFADGLVIGRRLGDAPLMSQALGGLSRVALRSDVAEGRRLAREALEISDAAGDRHGRSNAMHLLGVGAQMAGDLVEARDWMRQRLALVREDHNDWLISSEAANLSMVERQLGDLDAADALVREALVIAQRRGDRFVFPFALSGLAAIATERSEFERAAQLVGAAEAMMAEQDAAWPPDERPHYERLLTTLPTSMGASAFEQARAVGRSMASDDAVAYALE
jgi:tetratricopeptide (TPR) repeat protein